VVSRRDGCADSTRSSGSSYDGLACLAHHALVKALSQSFKSLRAEHGLVRSVGTVLADRAFCASTRLVVGSPTQLTRSEKLSCGGSSHGSCPSSR